MKLSLLDIVQRVLSSMDSDEVNSINDTIESLQVADIVRDEYFDLYSLGTWKNATKLGTLSSSADNTKPTHMILPENVIALDFIKYLDVKITYKEPEDFLLLVDGRNSDNDDIFVSTDVSGISLKIKNNAVPLYWTSFDDNNIVFDSWVLADEAVMQTINTKCSYRTMPVFSLIDTFVPDMPSDAFSTLVASCKSTAYLQLKQMRNGIQERKSRRGENWMAQNNWRASGGFQHKGYGRKR